MKKKLISLFTLSTLWMGNLSALADTSNWTYYGDSQQDSLPTPGGEFEITGIAIKEDEEFVYIAIQANKNLLTGVPYKTATIFSGDLFINEFGIRTSPLNNSGLSYGSLYNNLTYKTVSPFVFGQSSISEYESKLRELGQIPYNGTYSSKITGELASSGQFVSNIEFITPAEANLPPYLGENMTIVKIPKIFFPDLNLNISFSLECLNDILSISHTISPIPVDSPPVLDTPAPIPSNSFEDKEISDGDFPILETSLGLSGAILLFLLINSNDDIIERQPPIIPNPTPTPPDGSRDIPENIPIWPFLSILFLKRNGNKKI